MRGLVMAALIGISSVSFAGPRDLSFSASCNPSSAAVLSFSGDILIHNDLYTTVMKSRSQDFSQLWQKTNVLISKADFSVANLEGPAGLGVDKNGRDNGDVGFTYDLNIYSGTKFSFNYHPRILQDLKNSGYDLLTTANNHALDRSSLGIDRTLEGAAQVGIPTVGTRHSQDRNGSYYQVATIKGLNVAFIACTEMTNGISDRKDQVLYCYKHGEKIKTLITQLKQQSSIDAIIVLPHWGVEYEALPEKNQTSYARKFLEAGATAVIGSHPHVLQPWEKYVTSDGRETLILYSLGNFLAFQAGMEKKTGVVAYLGLSKNGGVTQISGVAYAPTYRDGYEVFPLNNSGLSKDMLSHYDANFGLSSRVQTQESLETKICP